MAACANAGLAVINRLGAFKTTLSTLNSAENKPVWFQKDPLVFTTKVDQAASAVAELEKFCQAQGTVNTGAAAQKAKEAAEAEAAAFQMACALVEWFNDQNDKTSAGKMDLSRSELHALRDEALRNQLQTTLDLAQGVVSGPQAADAAKYGITVAKVQALGKEIQEFVDVLAAPQAGIADRKALTGAMRDRFNAVAAKFSSLDNLILQFGGSDAGRKLIAAYQAARIVRDLGAGPSPKQPPTPPPAK
jgi:hypothetical protein